MFIKRSLATESGTIRLLLPRSAVDPIDLRLIHANFHGNRISPIYGWTRYLPDGVSPQIQRDETVEGADDGHPVRYGHSGGARLIARALSLARSRPPADDVPL